MTKDTVSPNPKSADAAVWPDLEGDAPPGRTTRVAGIAEDITERKSCEKERARLAAIVEYCNDAVVSMTVDGTIISWSPGAERQYGYTAAEIVGQSISLLFPPDHFQEYLQIMAKVGRGEAISAHDRVRLRKDGSLINVSVGVLPIESRHGEVLGASKIGHDLTEINPLEAQFIAAQKMEVIGQLAGGVAHDFNNILSIILCYSDWMARDLKSDDPTRKHAEEIRDAAARAAALTRQLLVFSRKQQVQTVVLDLNELVKGMDQMLRRLIDEKIELTFSLDDHLGRVKADAGYLGQVLMNLVVNARDAMPDGGHLSIATSNVAFDEDFIRGHPEVAPGDYVMLSVSDTGTGMTDDVKAHLFEAFFTTKPKGSGTGLGLATCLTIVRQSNGHITVTSEVEEGTTFEVFLPRVDEPVETAARPAPQEALPRGTETLLLAEDEPSVRHLANNVLESLGYTVLRANNGQDGLRVAREHRGEPIRLVVTDVIMPLMGGKLMAEWLRATYPSIKILFTSGYTDDAMSDVLDPSVAFLAKPYTPMGLARTVREMLDLPHV